MRESLVTVTILQWINQSQASSLTCHPTLVFRYCCLRIKIGICIKSRYYVRDATYSVQILSKWVKLKAWVIISSVSVYWVKDLWCQLQIHYFIAKLHINLIAWQESKNSYPRLPSAIKTFATTGYVNFFVNITDKYKFFKNLTYTFNFGDSSKEKRLLVNKTRHIYRTVGNYFVLVNVNASSRYYNSSLLLSIDCKYVVVMTLC